MMESKHKNKGLIIAIVAVFVISVAVTGYFYFSSLCSLDGMSVCVDKQTQTFLIEENAKITVQVESEKLGQYLSSTWDELHPDNKGAVTYEVSDVQSLEAMTNKTAINDVMVVSQNNAAYFMTDYFDLGRRASALLGKSVPVLHQDSINVKGYYFIANSVSGPLFVYNKTLMENLDFDTTDADNSGLPDTFESWDLIMEAAPKITESIDVVFPLTFEDQSMFYPFLTGGRWTLNFTKNGSNPAYDSNEFLDGLELIQAMGGKLWDITTALEEPVEPSSKSPEDASNENQVNPENDENESLQETRLYNKSDSLKWQYETAFYDNKALFTIVDDFDLLSKYEKKNNAEYVFAPFPLYNDYRLTPLAEVSGYVVSNTTKYPSAAAEAIRILRTAEGVSIFNASTGKIPSYHRNYLDELDIESKKDYQKVVAYGYSDTLPVMALNNNPSVLSRSLYFEVDIMDPLKKLFDGEITKEEARDKIVRLSQDWIDKNDIIVEE